MNNDEMKNAPKLFCESIKLAYTPEYFIFGARSGNQGQLYTLTPQHAKRLQQYLNHQMSEYESKHGEIDAKWDPKIISPMQPGNPSDDVK